MVLVVKALNTDNIQTEINLIVSLCVCDTALVAVLTNMFTFLQGTRLTSLLITGAELNYLSKLFKAFNQHEIQMECFCGSIKDTWRDIS